MANFFSTHSWDLCPKILHISMELFLNVSLILLNSVTKIFVIIVKGFEPAISCVREHVGKTPIFIFILKNHLKHGDFAFYSNLSNDGNI